MSRFGLSWNSITVKEVERTQHGTEEILELSNLGEIPAKCAGKFFVEQARLMFAVSLENYDDNLVFAGIWEGDIIQTGKLGSGNLTHLI